MASRRRWSIAALREGVATIKRQPESAAIASGIAGGAAMAMYEMIAIGIAGGDVWRPIALIAASVDGMQVPFVVTSWLRLTIGVALHAIASGFWGHKYARVMSYLPSLARSPIGTLPGDEAELEAAIVAAMSP